MSNQTSKDTVPIEQLLRAEDVAKVLNVSRTQAYRLMRESLPVVRFGGATVRVRLSDLESFIASHVQGGEG
jgi:excisionase family DNA binding protein